MARGSGESTPVWRRLTPGLAMLLGYRYISGLVLPTALTAIAGSAAIACLVAAGAVKLRATRS